MNYRLYSKKSTKSSGFMDIIYWTISVIFSIWLFWIIINPSQKGLIGNFVFSNLYSFFGNSVYFFPFLFFYGLMRILFKLGKPNKGIISMLFGTILILSFISAIMERSHFSGGWAGYFIDSLMIKLFGNIGSVIFSLGFILIGINIIFEVKWGKVFEKLKNTIQRDWEEWKKARAELNNKIKIIEEKKKSGEKVLSVKPANEVIVKKEEKEIKPPEQPQVSDLVKTEETKKDKKQIEKNESKAQIKNKDFLDFKNFKLPDINLLEKNTKSNVYLPDNSEIQSAKIKLEETLKNFEISAYISGIYPGPVITRYEITPSPGVKISSIVSLSNDIALAMRSIGSIRVIAPIPGKSAIGFEIPNSKRSMVTLREIIESPEFNSSKGNLTFALGRYSEGSVAVANLEDMPHLLVAGATGSGKSVFLQSMILSIMYKNTPDDVKFLFIDPKRLELTSYEQIPYLYDPRTTPDKVRVITDPKEAAKSLVALTRVMEKRYKKFEKARVKNIQSYNKWALSNNQPTEFYIVVVIDELADLMLQAKNVVEESIQRLTQMARAVGIHVVLATQRPSVDVITGVIKANLPCRVALQVSSKIDSRVIIDSPGAESLIGKGDMLFLGPNKSKPDRIQGCYVKEEEIEKVVSFLKEQGGPSYPSYIEEEVSFEGKGASNEELNVALRLILERRRVSQDLLKAHFGSSARATNLLSLLEVKGFIYKPEGTNKWQIYFDKIEAFLNAAEGSKQ
ncbi:MAG TPA: DNA translocase FtsK 4TM domain-containing protein [Elusimicrobiales bacterium]|nr:DNA translocase FtsK 4TM domain-containing protein [Elusimicrobiales bacterium]HOL62884.1 DNA translocase FtsK 4TM domain-containing protein [Elusimicrobiales bacterium]HPO94998.1 DNA translocase FtsK 4TM domain-containing protein [Elusimicrobiales bacterium]